MSKKIDMKNSPPGRPLDITATASRWTIGIYENGQHTVHFTGTRVIAAVLNVTGWQGGTNGAPVMNENVVTKSVQVVDDSPIESTVYIVFELSGGQAELGVQGIQYFQT
jgi:hypothetical protein